MAEISTPEEAPSQRAEATDPPDAPAGLDPTFEEPAEDRARPLVQRTELVRGTALAVPRPGASPFQDALAAGNAAARAASAKKLADWFPGYDFEQAAQDVDSRR